MTQKKRPQPRAKKIKIDPRAGWEQILKEVDKDEIPITVLQCLKVNLTDGTVVEIKIKEMIEEGQLPVDIQNKLNRQLDELNDYIEDVDFYVDIDMLSATVQPVTDQLLKRLKK